MGAAPRYSKVMQNSYRSKSLTILMYNILPELHQSSSLLRKLNAKISILFLYFLLFSSFFLSSFPSCITQKVYGTYKRSICQTTALLSEIFLFLVRAACELKSMSYCPKHASQWLSYMPFCAYLHVQLEN